MKLVINRCYGGFSLSPLAVKRLAELNGKQAFFFVDGIGGKPRKSVAVEEAKGLFWSAFTVPNPDEVCPDAEWSELTAEQRQAHNAAYNAISLNSRPDNRADPLLVQVVEELGEAANGDCADLKIVEIPDGVAYEIDEYDGIEHVAEMHRTWQ